MKIDVNIHFTFSAPSILGMSFFEQGQFRFGARPRHTQQSSLQFGQNVPNAMWCSQPTVGCAYNPNPVYTCTQNDFRIRPEAFNISFNHFLTQNSKQNTETCYFRPLDAPVQSL